MKIEVASGKTRELEWGHVLRTANTTSLVNGASLIAVLVLLVSAYSAWSAHNELKSRLRTLAGQTEVRNSDSKQSVGGNDEFEADIRRLVLSASAFTAVRQADADAQARLHSSLMDTDYRLRERPGLPMAMSATDQVVTIRDVRTSMDNMVARAKLSEIEITTSQTARTSSASEPETITASVKGTYSGVRSWLIEVTDADPELLLSSVQFRRENRGQPRVTAEVKFVRVEPTVAR